MSLCFPSRKYQWVSGAGFAVWFLNGNGITIVHNQCWCLEALGFWRHSVCTSLLLQWLCHFYGCVAGISECWGGKPAGAAAWLSRSGAFGKISLSLRSPTWGGQQELSPLRRNLLPWPGGFLAGSGTASWSIWNIWQCRVGTWDWREHRANVDGFFLFFVWVGIESLWYGILCLDLDVYYFLFILQFYKLWILQYFTNKIQNCSISIFIRFFKERLSN